MGASFGIGFSLSDVQRLNVAPRGVFGSAVIKRRTNMFGVFPNNASKGLLLTSSTPGWLTANRWTSRRNGNRSAAAHL